MTTNGHPFLDEYQAYPHAEAWWKNVSHEELSDTGMLYHEFEVEGRDRNRALAGVTGSFGLTMHDPAYVEREWSRTFAVVGVKPGEMSNRQDLVVLRAPSAT